MKLLNFRFRDEFYQVNEKGQIRTNKVKYFANDWVFLGGSSHHWHNRITVSLADAFKNPGKLNNCLGWDLDHGTVRQWGGSYNGSLPRIRNAYVSE